jgi:hypothetical protein
MIAFLFLLLMETTGLGRSLSDPKMTLSGRAQS